MNLLQILAWVAGILATIELLVFGANALLEKAWNAGGAIFLIILLVCIFTLGTAGSAVLGVILLIIEIILGIVFIMVHPRTREH